MNFREKWKKYFPIFRDFYLIRWHRTLWEQTFQALLLLQITGEHFQTFPEFLLNMVLTEGFEILIILNFFLIVWKVENGKRVTVRKNWSKIWDSRIPEEHIWSMFDLVAFEVIFHVTDAVDVIPCVDDFFPEHYFLFVHMWFFFN